MKKYLLKSIVAFIFLLIAGEAYAQRPNNYTNLTSTPTVGVPVTITPNRGGGNAATSFAINATPALLNGLGFNTTTGVISGTPTAISAATTYTITPSNASGAGNPFTVRITVGKGTVVITADNVNKTYGTTLSNGASSTGFTATGLAPGATIATVVLTYNTGTTAGAPGTANVNTYTNQIAVSGAIGGGNFNQNNYNITYSTNKGDITVTQATLTATAGNNSKFQGSANPNPLATVTYTGFVNNENQNVIGTLATLSTTATTTSPIGTYPITPSGANDNNYTFNYVAGTLTVKLAPPNITYPAANFIVGTTVSISPTNTGGAIDSYSINPLTLPAGLTFNTTTGVISGTPTVAGTATYTVTATNTATPGTSTATVKITVSATGTNIYDWTGVVSTDWANPLNWDVNNVQQTTNYPGSALNTDVADIGVNTALAIITRFPILSTANITIASLAFGNNNAPLNNNTGGLLSLTINGFTLTVTNAITQAHSSTGGSGLFTNSPGVTTSLLGNGAIICGSLTVGDVTNLPGNAINSITQFNIGITTAASTLSVTVNGDFTINSASNGGLIVKNSFAQVSLAAGTLTINGTLRLVNGSPSSFYFVQQFAPEASFSIDLNNFNSPVLNLAGATPLNIGNNNLGNANNSVDFFNPPTTAHLHGTVNYTGTNQEVYNNNGGAMNKYIDNNGAANNDGYVYDNLGFSGTGTKTLDAGAFKVAGTFTLATSGTTVSLVTNKPVLTVGGDYSTVTGSTFTNGTGAITLGGNFTNGGTTTFGAPLVTFNATTAVSLTTTAPLTLTNVAFNNNGKKSLTNGVFNLVSTGVLAMGGTTTVLDAGAGGTLNLASDANSTASVATIPAGCSINGQVNVQRYISAFRGYRLMSSPVNSGTTTQSGIYGINYLINNVVLTGTNGTTGGFDKASGPTLYIYKESFAGNNSAFTAGNFRDITDITGGLSTPPVYMIDLVPTSVSIPVGTAYLMYFRGDRTSYSLDLETSPGWPATAATVTATGVLTQGSVTYQDLFNGNTTSLSYANAKPGLIGFNSIGNPYACTIDLETLNKGGITAPGISNFIYELDPVSQAFEIYTVGGSVPAVKNATRYISSGQGFFVQAMSAGQTVTINEAAKVTGTGTQNQGAKLLMATSAPLASTMQYLRVQMIQDSITNIEAIINFKSTAKTTYDVSEDAIFKAGGSAMVLSSMSADSRSLAINQLPLAQKGQTIRLTVSGTPGVPYTLSMNEIKGIPEEYDVWLKDADKKDSVDLRLNPNYPFTILASDTGSYGAYRFAIVLRQNPAKAYKLISFDANKTPTKDVELVWVTQNEENYTNFTVERSADNGKTYDVVGGMPSTGAGTYSLTDKHPADHNMYRLKQEDINDSISYSNVVKIDFSNRGDDRDRNVNVYPNPARDRVTFAIESKGQFYKSPTYKIEITNSWGLILQQTTSKQPEWQTNVGRFMPGTYYVRVVNEKDGSLVGQNKFVKL